MITEQRRKYKTDWQRNYRKTNDVKTDTKQYFAHRLTRYAIKRGFIIWSVCVECGSESSEAHHEDYNNPIDVTWLCRLHHCNWHRDNGEGLHRDDVLNTTWHNYLMEHLGTLFLSTEV